MDMVKPVYPLPLRCGGYENEVSQLTRMAPPFKSAPKLPPVSDVLGVAFVELSVIIILLTGISRAVAAT